MARFFKFIFHVLLIAYIAVILALVLPPLVGYTTATVQENTSGNQAVGTVDYAKRIPLQELKAGEQILVTGADSVNVYTVQFVDEARSMVTVADAANQEIPVRSYVYRMVLAVPFIGYIVIALQTMEGVIVLAMIAVLLLLFCVLCNIWSRKAKEKKLRRKEQKKEEAEKRAAEQADQKDGAEQNTSDSDRILNARAEAYFAARRAEQNQPAPFEEYEDFPPKAAKAEDTKEVLESLRQEVQNETEYFDDEEDNEEADSWLHDDVDDEDLFAGLDNRAATESLMATARLFAINRAAQLKEQIAAEDTEKTRVVAPEELAAVQATAEAKAEEKKPAAKKTVSAPVKEIEVDKVINLKELKELDEDTQQIVLTINIKVVPE